MCIRDRTKDFFIGDKEKVLTDPVSPGTDGGLVIVGDSYDACRKTNEYKSYQIGGDGQFIYFDGDEEWGGAIDDELKRLLAKSVAKSHSDLPSDTSASGCSCYRGEAQIEFIYTIEYKSQTYKLDTCHGSFAAQSDLGQLLMDFWDILPGSE